MMLSVVNFKMTELFKERGFEPLTSETWVVDPDGRYETISDWEMMKGKWDEDWYKDTGLHQFSQALACQWLEEKHSIEIITSRDTEDKYIYNAVVNDWRTAKRKTFAIAEIWVFNCKRFNGYESKSKAIDSALEYVLNELLLI